MPWPMIHFAVAHYITNGAPSSELLIGSIAPDAIHARPGTTRQDKKVTHLSQEGKHPQADMFLRLCMDELKRSRTREQRSFVLGYFAHIYTDLRWVQTLYTDFKRDEGQVCNGDKEHLNRVYYGECAQLEFELMRSEPWTSNVLDKLRVADAYAFSPYITADEAARYRDVKLQWLLNEENEPRLPLRYFTLERVRDFIVMTSNEWLALQQEIEQLIGQHMDA